MVSKRKSFKKSYQKNQFDPKESEADVSIESYMTWDRKYTDHRAYLKYIQTEESHFGVYTINAFASGSIIPLAAEVAVQVVGFDENKKFNSKFENLSRILFVIIGTRFICGFES